MAENKVVNNTFNENVFINSQGDRKERKKSSSKSREATPKAPKKALGDDEDSDDSYWDDSGDESTESSSDDDPGMSLREKFLKKVMEYGKGPLVMVVQFKKLPRFPQTKGSR